MKCIDDQTTHELAQSSTILQCIISMLDFESLKFGVHAEVLWVGDNEALVDLDYMDNEQIDGVCNIINPQFRHLNQKLACRQENPEQPYVRCRAFPLKDYIRLT